jgi:hypothetical protein
MSPGPETPIAFICVSFRPQKGHDVRRKKSPHIHFAHANLAPCDEERALRLFVADELLDAGVTPADLLQAQGFDPTPLALLKADFNPAQPRWPAGSGRDSGEWSGGAGGHLPLDALACGAPVWW